MSAALCCSRDPQTTHQTPPAASITAASRFDRAVGCLLVGAATALARALLPVLAAAAPRVDKNAEVLTTERQSATETESASESVSAAETESASETETEIPSESESPCETENESTNERVTVSESSNKDECGGESACKSESASVGEARETRETRETLQVVHDGALDVSSGQHDHATDAAAPDTAPAAISASRVSELGHHLHTEVHFDAETDAKTCAGCDAEAGADADTEADADTDTDIEVEADMLRELLLNAEDRADSLADLLARAEARIETLMDDNDEADATCHAVSRLAHSRGKAVAQLQTELEQTLQHATLLEHKLETVSFIASDAIDRVDELERRIQELEQHDVEMLCSVDVCRELVRRAFVERDLAWVKTGGAMARLECVRQDRDERTEDAWRLEQRVRELENELEQRARREDALKKMLVQTTVPPPVSSTESKSKPVQRMSTAAVATAAAIAGVPVAPPTHQQDTPTQALHIRRSTPAVAHPDVAHASSTKPKTDKRRGPSPTRRVAATPTSSSTSSRASTSPRTTTKTSMTTAVTATMKPTAKSMIDKNSKKTNKTQEAAAVTTATVCVRLASRLVDQPTNHK